MDVCGRGKSSGEVLCKNGGKCVEGVGANYTCVCRSGFTGANCQLTVSSASASSANLCSPNPCLNGGQCEISSTSATYICKCALTFSGKNCELEMDDNNKCKNYCFNNSTCIVSKLSYKVGIIYLVLTCG